MDSQKYPIGYYKPPKTITAQDIDNWIEEIAGFPDVLQAVVSPLSEDQLALRYREGGWTIRQVVYHLGDSHLNSYVRFMWALTENSPKIKAYDEAAWAELHPDSPIDPALSFLQMLHIRWVELMRSLDARQWDLTFTHPETGREIPLKKNLGLYAWHGQHHLAHIRMALG